MQNLKFLESHSFTKYTLKYNKNPMMSMSDHTRILTFFYTFGLAQFHSLTVVLRVSKS